MCRWKGLEAWRVNEHQIQQQIYISGSVQNLSEMGTKSSTISPNNLHLSPERHANLLLLILTLARFLIYPPPSGISICHNIINSLTLLFMTAVQWNLPYRMSSKHNIWDIWTVYKVYIGGALLKISTETLFSTNSITNADEYSKKIF